MSIEGYRWYEVALWASVSNVLMPLPTPTALILSPAAGISEEGWGDNVGSSWDGVGTNAFLLLMSGSKSLQLWPQKHLKVSVANLGHFPSLSRLSRQPQVATWGV